MLGAVDGRLRAVELEPKRLADYRETVGDETLERLSATADAIAGRRVLHVSSTAFGGGVAEDLGSLLPLLRDLGVDVHWWVLDIDDGFVTVTKAMHNGLQGMDVAWTADMEATYLDTIRAHVQSFEGGWDTVVVHDPQPCALVSFLADDAAHADTSWVWRCHLDATHAHAEVWEFLRPHVERYDCSIWTMDEFVPDSMDRGRVTLFPPCIDPLAPKNAPLDEEAITAACEAHGVDRSRPLMVQVSRFDPWKDPVGVIEAHRAIRRRVPDAQLALIGSMADDDPEGPRYRSLAEEARDGDDDIHLLENLDDREVNALQRAAGVVMQKSIREGFGLTVSEALWKRRPVVGTRVGGITLQIRDGVDGYLVDGVEEAAERAADLLLDPTLADEMGGNGTSGCASSSSSPDWPSPICSCSARADARAL